MSEETRQPSRISVLLVEDNPPARVALARILELEGYVVISAGTLGAAADKLDGQAALVLDLELPDGLGTELLGRIRREGRELGVVVLSGADDGLIAEAQRLAPDVMMRKPVDVAELLKWLRELTRRRSDPT